MACSFVQPRRKEPRTKPLKIIEPMLKHNQYGLVVSWKLDKKTVALEIYTSLKKFTDKNPGFDYGTVTNSYSWKTKKRYETAAVLIQKVPVV